MQATVDGVIGIEDESSSEESPTQLQEQKDQ
jgi:hypothetical protein